MLKKKYSFIIYECFTSKCTEWIKRKAHALETTRSWLYYFRQSQRLRDINWIMDNKNELETQLRSTYPARTIDQIFRK